VTGWTWARSRRSRFEASQRRTPPSSGEWTGWKICGGGEASNGPGC
jgi:hypothetical protein